MLISRKPALSVLISCLVLSACSAPQSYWVEAPDAYGNQLSFEQRQLADQSKEQFIEKRLEEVQIQEDSSDAQIRVALAHEYERSVRTLYSGSLANEQGLSEVLKLVSYAPDLFRNAEFEQQLRKRSDSLYNLHIDMQINKAFCSSGADVYEP